MSGSKRHHRGSLIIKPPDQVRADGKRALDDVPLRPEQGAYTPLPSALDHFEVLLYSKVHGNYIHDSYHRTERAAKDKRRSLEAFGNEAKVEPVNRIGPPDPDKAPAPPRASTPPPTPDELRILELQRELRELWARVGLAHLAMPCGVVKLAQLIEQARAALQRKSPANGE
jgi:hypothetical protein